MTMPPIDLPMKEDRRAVARERLAAVVLSGGANKLETTCLSGFGAM
jgi:hypothetical protein